MREEPGQDSGWLTRMPTRTPYDVKAIPAAQPRRSSFSIHVDFHLSRGTVQADMSHLSPSYARQTQPELQCIRKIVYP